MEQSENSETVYSTKASVETVPAAATAVSILLKSLSFILPLLYICDNPIRNRIISVISEPMTTAAVIAEIISIRLFFRRFSASSLGVMQYLPMDIPNHTRAASGIPKNAARKRISINISIRYTICFSFPGAEVLVKDFIQYIIYLRGSQQNKF